MLFFIKCMFKFCNTIFKSFWYNVDKEKKEFTKLYKISIVKLEYYVVS